MNVNKAIWVAAITITIGILSFILISSPLSQNENNIEKTISHNGVGTKSGIIILTPETQTRIQTQMNNYGVPPNSWSFDPFYGEIDLFATDENEMMTFEPLEGKRIENYTIHIFNTSISETTRIEVRQYLLNLKNDSAYQIDDISMAKTSDRSYVELWCKSLTPQNIELNQTAIKGWRILVYPLSYPRQTYLYLKLNSPKPFS